MTRGTPPILVLVVLGVLACESRARPVDLGARPGGRNGSAPPSVQPVRIAPGPDDARNPDGRVVRVGKVDTVMIDLGLGDHIRQGTTYEIFDANAGIPAAGAGRAKRGPGGKATVEVIRIAPGYSECRVIRRTPGEAVAVGDLIVGRPPPAGNGR